MIVYSSRRLKHDFQTWVNLVTTHHALTSHNTVFKKQMTKETIKVIQ